MAATDIDIVLDVIQQVGGVTGIAPDRDFYEAGVTSVMALPLLIELETRFGVTIPDGDFIEARTPRALTDVLARLRNGAES